MTGFFVRSFYWRICDLRVWRKTYFAPCEKNTK